MGIGLGAGSEEETARPRLKEAQEDDRNGGEELVVGLEGGGGTRWIT